MPENLPECIICRSDEHAAVDSWASKYLGLIPPYAVKRCGKCGLKWLSPRPTTQEYADMYKGDQYFSSNMVPEVYEEVVKKRIQYYEKRCEKIIRIEGISSCKLLDIGAATGVFVRVAKNSGLEAEGVEISKWACKTAKVKNNVKLRNVDLFTANFPSEAFNVVHMHHVFEHIPNPLAFLEETHRILKKDGLVVLEVPYQFDNILEKTKKLFGRTKFRAYSLFSVHHPFFYSPGLLQTLLEQCKFDVLSINTFDKDNPNSETNSDIPFGKFIKLLILGGGGFFNQGDFIEIYAKKV